MSFSQNVVNQLPLINHRLSKRGHNLEAKVRSDYRVDFILKDAIGTHAAASVIEEEAGKWEFINLLWDTKGSSVGELRESITRWAAEYP